MPVLPIPCPFTEPLPLRTTWGLPAGESSEPGLSAGGERGEKENGKREGDGDRNRTKSEIREKMVGEDKGQS